jgi:CBS domain-containing protein
MVTDRDIACRAVAEGCDVSRATARDIMTEPVVSVAPEATVEDCCDLLEDHQLRRILVVDSTGAVCGIVAQADIARFAPRKETAEVVREVSRPEARREVETPV